MEGFLILLGSLWGFWALFIFMMGVYRAFLKKRLKGLSLILSIPFLVVAFLVDFLMQMTVFSVLFWDWPKHWLVTHRLRFYKKTLPKTTRRYRFADYLCKHLLDPFDPTGEHCDEDPPIIKE
jgi:hypothetical protein